MKKPWCWHLGTFAGVGVYVHATFLFIVALVMMGKPLAEGLLALGMIVAIFGCVVLHEYGHVLMARRYGIGTRDITLYPIGGVATLARPTFSGMEELMVAIAGPAVNVAIAIAIWGLLWLAGSPVAVTMDISGLGFLQALMVINVMLVVFNMIPAWPMDGGRVLRGVLSLGVGHLLATKVATALGMAIGGGFVMLGIMGNVFLIFIGVLVFLSSLAEYNMVGRTGPWQRATSSVDRWDDPDEDGL